MLVSAAVTMMLTNVTLGSSTKHHLRTPGETDVSPSINVFFHTLMDLSLTWFYLYVYLNMCYLWNIE